MRQILLGLSLFLGGICSADCYYLQVKPSYLRFDESALREIYGEANYATQVEGCWYACENLGVVLNVEYGSFKGWAINDTPLETPSTSLRLWSGALLAAYFYPCFDCAKLYINAGPELFYLKTVDNDPYVQHVVTKWTCGGKVGLGAMIPLWCSFFVNPFIDYSLGYMHFSPNESSIRYSVKLNNIKAGIGVGYEF